TDPAPGVLHPAERRARGVTMRTLTGPRSAHDRRLLEERAVALRESPTRSEEVIWSALRARRVFTRCLPRPAGHATPRRDLEQRGRRPFEIPLRSLGNVRAGALTRDPGRAAGGSIDGLGSTSSSTHSSSSRRAALTDPGE